MFRFEIQLEEVDDGEDSWIKKPVIVERIDEEDLIVQEVTLS